VPGFAPFSRADPLEIDQDIDDCFPALLLLSGPPWPVGENCAFAGAGQWSVWLRPGLFAASVASTARTGPRQAAQRSDAVPGGPGRGAFRCEAVGRSEGHGKAFETGLRIDPNTGIDVRNARCSRLKTFEASFVRPIGRTTLQRVHLTMPDPNKGGGEEGRRSAVSADFVANNPLKLP
jgi:hypothetical protein